MRDEVQRYHTFEAFIRRLLLGSGEGGVDFFFLAFILVYSVRIFIFVILGLDHDFFFCVFLALTRHTVWRIEK